VAKLPHFVNLELNGNQISEAGVEAIRSLLHGAGKILGGKRAHCLLPLCPSRNALYLRDVEFRTSSSNHV
jgi:hypothetical protein